MRSSQLLALVLSTLCAINLSTTRALAASSSNDDQEAPTTKSLVASTRRLNYEQSHYPSFVRISVLGGASMPDTSGSSIGMSGAVLGDFGRGLLTFETGAQYLSLSTPVSLDTSDGSPNQKIAVMSQYVGVPLLLKINYIERKTSSFSFKIGAMPALMINNRDTLTNTTGTDTTNSSQGVVLNGNEVFGVAGFTGSAPLSDNVAFLLDGSYLYGTSNVDYNGSHAQGLLFSAGLRFSL